MNEFEKELNRFFTENLNNYISMDLANGGFAAIFTAHKKEVSDLKDEIAGLKKDKPDKPFDPRMDKK